MMMLIVFILALFEGISERLAALTPTDSATEAETSSEAPEKVPLYYYAICRSDGTATEEPEESLGITITDEGPPILGETTKKREPDKPPGPCTWAARPHLNEI